jgi:hypothetical protein
MRVLFLLFSLLLSSVALPYGIPIVLSGGAQLPNTYTVGNAQSAVITCKNSNVVEVLNHTALTLGVGLSRSSSIAPSVDYGFVPPGPAAGNKFSVKGGIGNDTTIFVRSTTTAGSSGSYTVSCFNEEKGQ